MRIKKPSDSLLCPIHTPVDWRPECPRCRVLCATADTGHPLVEETAGSSGERTHTERNAKSVKIRLKLKNLHSIQKLTTVNITYFDGPTNSKPKP